LLTVAEIQDLSEFADFQKAFQAKKYYYICTSETTMICYFSVHACTVDEYAVENVLYAVHLPTVCVMCDRNDNIRSYYDCLFNKSGVQSSSQIFIV
jgi:hypothetical protein